MEYLIFSMGKVASLRFHVLLANHWLLPSPCSSCFISFRVTTGSILSQSCRSRSIHGASPIPRSLYCPLRPTLIEIFCRFSHPFSLLLSSKIQDLPRSSSLSRPRVYSIREPARLANHILCFKGISEGANFSVLCESICLREGIYVPTRFLAHLDAHDKSRAIEYRNLAD